MKEYMVKSGGEGFVGWRYFITLGIFMLLYIVGIMLPLEFTPHYHSLMSRVWNWTDILILLVALYYIARTRIFKWHQAVLALLLGLTCLVSLFRDPRTADIIVTCICVTTAFYAAFRLFELANVENASNHMGIAESVRYFALGAVIAMPLAFLNVLYFSFSREISVGNILSSAIFAWKPAIAEEVVFRFFGLAYAYHVLQGKAESRFFHVCIYILLVIPHELLHYPDLLIKSPGPAFVMCLLNGAFFGLPMALSMKRKNLQMAIGMHWFVDFARFACGF